MGPDRGLRRQTCISLTSTAANRRVLDPLGRTGMNYFFSDLGNLRVEIAGDSPIVSFWVCRPPGTPESPTTPSAVGPTWQKLAELRNSGPRAAGEGLERVQRAARGPQDCDAAFIRAWGQPRFSYLWHDDSPWQREVLWIKEIKTRECEGVARGHTLAADVGPELLCSESSSEAPFMRGSRWVLGCSVN